MADPVFAEYYADQDDVARTRLEQIEELVRSIAPDVAPAMAYGMPTFRRQGKNFVHWGGFPHHVGFYPQPATVAAFSGEFGTRTWAKGSVQFPHEEPLPLDLIERMVRFRLTL